MKKKPADSGLLYVQKVGIKPARDMQMIYSMLTSKYGRLNAEKFLDTINELARSNKDQQYEFKNANFDKCMIYTGGFDADIVRSASNWIVKNKDYFGEKILDVGCDCGFVSCFLGLTFPQARIISIDKGTNGINIAKQIAAKLGVHNIEFKSCALKDLTESGFDTVFTMRTMHENIQDDSEEDSLLDISEQADIYCEHLDDYAKDLLSKLTDDGCLVSIERISRDALFLGWLESLGQNGMGFLADCYEELTCNELDEMSKFQAFICFKSAEEAIEPIEVFGFACERNIALDLPKYEGDDANNLLELKRGELLKGYVLEDSMKKTRIKLAAWTHKYDDTGMIFFRNMNGNSTIEFYDLSQKDDLLSEIEKAAEEFRNINGAVVKDLRR